MRAVAALLVAIGLIVLPAADVLPGPGRIVMGSCVGQPTLEDGLAQARVVFVGTVAFLENSNRWVIVNVEERWHGAEELGASVEVR